MRWIVALLAGMTMAGALSSHAQKSTAVTIPEADVNALISKEDFEGKRRGDCLTPSGEKVDMLRILFVSNDWVQLTENGERVRLRLEEQHLSKTHLDKWDEKNLPITEGVYGFGLPSALLPGDWAFDAEFSFAYVEGQLAIYWREPFKFRKYRQGLLKMDGTLFPKAWCQGWAGVTPPH